MSDYKVCLSMTLLLLLSPPPIGCLCMAVCVVGLCDDNILSLPFTFHVARNNGVQVCPHCRDLNCNYCFQIVLV